jgi:NADH:ubiquinone reductase (H+-translocating)
MNKKRVVIIGGGFAGAKCGKTLRKLLSPDECEIILFNKENHMVFHPLLAEIASNVIEPRQVAAPLRQMMKNVLCRTEEVVKLDLENHQICYEGEEGLLHCMSYDHLVISHGTTVNLAAIPGMTDHALPLKTVGDAIAIQSRVIEVLERAEVCDDLERKKRHLSIAVVGGGFSGVEVAGELNDFLRESTRFYQNTAIDDVCVTLVHGREQILPEVSPSLREFAADKMKKAGVKLVLNVGATMCTADGVALSDGNFVNAATVVCTIGTKPLPMIEELQIAKERGRLVTEPDMSLPAHKNVWAIGDCAAVMNALDGQYSPPTGQFAERQGSQVAHNIAARIKGQPTKPFSHKSLGSLCSIGGRNAVAEMMGMKISGFLAWFAWRGVYLLKLPTLSQQIKVGLQWACDIFFPPQLAVLKADQSKRIVSGLYPSGKFVFQAGDCASDFYVIKKGEIEILEPLEINGEYPVIAVMGPGDFFGERALIDNRPRKHHARAKTDVELLMIGKNIYTQISSSLAPLRDAVADSIKRRTPVWDKMPLGRQALETLQIQELTEPLITEPFRMETRLRDLIAQMRTLRIDSGFVVDDNNQLIGLVTRTDLIKAIEVAAEMKEGSRLGMKIKDLSIRPPLAICNEDSVMVALSTMREHGLKSLPVVDSHKNRCLKGVIRIESIFDALVQKLEPEPVVAGI